MEEKILDKIKESCKEKMERKKHLSNLIEQITELEENEIVRTYIKLKQELETVDYQKILGKSDAEILYETFWSHQYMMKETNGIYLCLGTFMLDNICDIEHGPSDIRVNRNDPRAEYRIYRNIENDFSEYIPIHKCEEFEKTHDIIYKGNFYELQKEFITLAVTEGQENACKRILKKHNK